MDCGNNPEPGGGWKMEGLGMFLIITEHAFQLLVGESQTIERDLDRIHPATVLCSYAIGPGGMRGERKSKDAARQSKTYEWDE